MQKGHVFVGLFLFIHVFSFPSVCVPQSEVCAWLVCPISGVVWLNVVLFLVSLCESSFPSEGGHVTQAETGVNQLRPGWISNKVHVVFCCGGTSPLCVCLCLKQALLYRSTVP